MASVRLGEAHYHLDRWDDIRFVLAAARAGSFLSAGEDLAISQATVSRRVQYLEKRLGIKIFERHPHGIRLTSSGTDLVDRATAMAEAADNIERHFRGADARLDGTVRITAPDGLLVHWLVPLLSIFRVSFPAIRVDLITAPSDLGAGNVDIAIQMNPPLEPRIVALRAAHVRFTLFAAQDYLDRYGTPRSMDDLHGHWIIDHIGQLALDQLLPWQNFARHYPKIACHSDTSSAFLASVRAGFGIGLFPDFYRMVAPDLVPIEVDTGCVGNLWLNSHEETKGSARIRAVLGFLRDSFRKDRGRWFSVEPTAAD